MKNEEQNLIQWLQWLDQNLDQGSAVLYVAFGSKAEISPQQFHEIAVENVNRTCGCVSRESEGERHRSEIRGQFLDMRAFRVLESVCAKVPILAWPMVAEKHLNERMLMEEIKVCLRVETSNGSVRASEKMVRELMDGEMGKEARMKVEEFGEAARKAMEEGGLSWHPMNHLIDELQALRGDSSKLWS
ncbi:hypothetical protein HYC85_006076 [Camellia sinensis]|uniref:Uncharacterized protein n=1 Tax=Camellia sinensis TaxID=4442 RepID=A0A7J7I2R8_CAMSI|nr:hypothetical protein HYC85_006076 [Camellia sinensis]